MTAVSGDREVREVSFKVYQQFIMVAENVVPWAQDLIDAAEQLGAWKQSSMISPRPGDNHKIHYGEFRNNTSVVVDGRRFPSLAHFEVALSRAVHPVVKFYIDQVSRGHLALHKDTYFEILRYDVGQHFKAHIDTIARHQTWGQRQLSAVLFLNDVPGGGELHFPHQNLTVTPKAGNLVLFPSNFCYPHESKDVTKGVKYSAVTWFI